MTPAHRLPTLPTDETYKKQRRRECHNQVEKRRREHINAKIEELSQLLPANYSQIDEAIGEEDEEDDDIESPIKKKVHDPQSVCTALTHGRRRSARARQPERRKTLRSARAGSSAPASNIFSMWKSQEVKGVPANETPQRFEAYYRHARSSDTAPRSPPYVDGLPLDATHCALFMDRPHPGSRTFPARTTDPARGHATFS